VNAKTISIETADRRVGRGRGVLSDLAGSDGRSLVYGVPAVGYMTLIVAGSIQVAIALLAALSPHGTRCG
jgi:hypothetical protein